jgi:hypothetical protein
VNVRTIAFLEGDFEKQDYFSSDNNCYFGGSYYCGENGVFTDI